MLLKTIAEYAEGAGVGVAGSTLFAYNMPETATFAVLLRQPLDATEVDYELPDYYKARFQVIVRCRPEEIEAGRARIDEAVSLLTILSETELSGMLVKYMRPRHLPVMYPVSEGNYLEFSVNFDVVYVIVPQ